MNTCPARAPNVETDERRATRPQREAVHADQRAFLESFDQQVASWPHTDDEEDE